MGIQDKNYLSLPPPSQNIPQNKKQEVQEETDVRQVLRNLNNLPLSRFDEKQLAERLLAKYKDPETIKSAIDNILKEDGRFSNINPEAFVVEQERFQHIKEHIDLMVQHPEQNFEETIKRVNNASKAIDPNLLIKNLDAERNPIIKLLVDYSEAKLLKEQEQMAKLQKNIAADLVGLVYRKPTSAESFKGADGQVLFLKQTHGHMEEGTFIPGYAISAELANKDEKVLELANQAFIAIHDNTNPEQSYEVILGRSGRTDMQSKIDDKSMLDMAARLESSSLKGLKAMRDLSSGKTYYEYQRADITMMDINIPKSAMTTVVSGMKRGKNYLQEKPLTPIESERKFVHDKRKAIDEEWQAGKQGVVYDKKRDRHYVERQVTRGSGTVSTVREYKPLVWNFVFSRSAESAANVKSARKDNIPNALYLFSQYQKQDPKVAEHFAHIEGRKNLAEALVKSLNNENIEWNHDQKIALEAMLVTLTGKDSKGNDYDNKFGSDTQFILLNHLADLTDTAITVECKSGNDRTATAMSIRCALKEFEKSTGSRYNPTVDQGDPDKFSKLFNKYAKEFGAPNVRASRGFDEQGRAVLKTRTSPTFTKFADREKMEKDFHLI